MRKTSYCAQQCGGRIAFCGPLAGIVTGQSVALRAAINSVPIVRRLEVDTGGSGLRWYQTIALMLRAILRLRHGLLYQGVDTLYVTPSRSIFGAARDLPFVVLSLLFGARIIAHWHGGEFYYLRQTPHTLLARVLRAVWQRAHIHIALCKTMQSHLQEFGFDDVRVIPNFCPKRSASADSRLQCARPFRLLYLSNLILEKGVGAALEMHRRLHKTGVHIELHVVGARLCSLPLDVEMALEGAGVIYHGPKYGAEKNALLDSCDVFVFPSTYRTEAFPLVLLEAMTAGLAVVAYRHNYIADFFEPAGGFLVPCNVDALTAAVRTLLNDRQLLAQFKKANLHAALSYSEEEYQQQVRLLLLEPMD